ncbi:urate hydroxylase PuuD [Halomonas elongata]|uniref:urate hydroxylase PuuD n=1 Tax=Halomonas elongata TaxID=2746 RepID=UPI0023AE6D25|nr:urate hydroxylase PuuD [Halomonas elongata]
MEAYLLDFANLLLRWLHVIAAIAWIGESIYFVMLDNGLRPPKADEDKEKGVFGEMWAVHGGGFYHNQKYASAPAKLPEDLHWSFWKSYATWLSGFGLFVLLYMVNPSFYLVNPGSDWAWAANLTGWQANVVALLFLLGGWVVYNELCKRISPNMDRDGILSLAVAVMMVVVAYLSTQIFSGRAAFLLTGAVMATAMSANVFFWIIPGQSRMVKAMKAGETPNPLDGKRGKQRSVHNTYFTLPVVLLMISNHYSFAYSHDLAWVIMTLFIFAGALIRQFFVLMHAGQIKPAYPAAGVVLILVAVWVGAPAGSGGGDAETASAEPSSAVSETETSDAEASEMDESVAASGTEAAGHAEQIVIDRCAQCHAENPSHEGFSAAPAGVALETPEQVLRQVDQIKQVVASGYMPLGNVTQMTDEERTEIANWSP